MQNNQKLNLETAKWLLQGARALLANPELQEWGGLKRTELLWLITDITGEEVIDDAIEKLEQAVEQGVPPTVPPELEKLTQDLEKHQEQVTKGQEASEEQVRLLRTSIVSAQLEEQKRGDLYVAPKEEAPATTAPAAPEPPQKPQSPTEVAAPAAVEEPIPFRRPLPNRPRPAPSTPKAPEATKPFGVTQGEPSVVERIASQIPAAPVAPLVAGPVGRITQAAPEKVVFVVKKSFSQPILRRLSNAPTRILRNVIAVGQEAVGQGPDAAQIAYASKLLNQGITSTSFRQAVNEYVKGTPGERGVIDALFKQADVLAEHEASHPFLARVTKSLFPEKYSQILIANDAAAPEQGRSVENFRTTINPAQNQISNLEYWQAGASAPQEAVSTLREDLGQQAVSARQNFVSRASIGTRNFITNVGQLFGKPQVAGAGARAGTSLLGGAFRALSGFGSGIGRIGAAVAGAAGGGGAAAVSAPTAVIVGAIVLVVALPLVFLMLGATHQGAYLGIEVIPLQNSAYIDVTKTAQPTSIRNEQLPTALSFTIKVTAKGRDLSNISVQDSITLLGGTRSRNINAPQSNYPKELASGESFTIPYSINAEATDEFKDSILSNIATVTADVKDLGLTGEISRVSASVTIGTPPTFCFTFEGPWIDSEKIVEREAIVILAKSPTYMKRLCGESNEKLIRLTRDRGDPGYRGEHFGQGPSLSVIKIYKNDFLANPWQSAYLLGHETGHAFAYRNPSAINEFRASMPAGVFIHTYPFAKTRDEDFAETIGVYVAWRNSPIINCCKINFPLEYPSHNSFAKEKIFGGVEF